MKQVVTELDLLLSIRILKNIEALRRTVIGSSLFANQASMLMDMRHPTALVGVLDMVQQAVFISPELAAITTPCSSAAWAERMTKLVIDKPLASIDKIRFRKSQHGGRP